MVSIAPKQQGFDFNFYQKLTINWVTLGNSANSAFVDGYQDGYQSDMLILFPTYGIMILNEATSTTVQVSFNGQTIHDEINSTLLPQGIMYTNRVVSGIWFNATK